MMLPIAKEGTQPASRAQIESQIMLNLQFSSHLKNIKKKHEIIFLRFTLGILQQHTKNIN
jgi:hypothetical protein